jgi:hypothetical protein
MRKCFYVVAILMFFVSLQSCYINRQLWYSSPLNVANQPYIALPTFKDSIKAATYCYTSIYSGLANDQKSDEVLLINLGVYRTKKLNNFQFYYGANFGFGSYKLRPLDSENTNYFKYNPILFSTLENSFSAIGLLAGINYTIKSDIADWRIFGLEFTTNNEFGNYLKFRESLQDSSTTFVSKSSNFTTLGANTEVILHNKNVNIGAKLSVGMPLGNDYINPKVYDIYDNSQRPSFTYTSLTLSLTHKKYTGYFQGNFGVKASGIRFGILYRL